MYIKANKNPYLIYGKMKLATKKNLIEISSNVELENIHLQGSSAHGIVKKTYTIENVFVHNCVIEKIGGAWQHGFSNENKVRYGNGIEFWCGASNIFLENNVISDIYDAGITFQGDDKKFYNIIANENIIKNTCYSFELWSSGNSSGMENVKIYNNYSINEGKGWGQSVRPNPYNSANFVFYGFGNNAEMDINIYNNHLFNSTRLYYVLYSIKDRFKSEIYIDNNYYFNDEELKYYVNDIKSDNAKSYLGTEYNIEKILYLENCQIVN